MAITKVVPQDYTTEESLRGLLSYVLTSEKCISGLCNWFSLYKGTPEYYCDQFLGVQKTYNKTEGNKLFHLVISIWKYSCLTAEDVYSLGYNIYCHLPQDHQIVYAVHEDTYNLHLHFLINSISYYSGKRLIVDRDFIYNIKLFADDTEQRLTKRRIDIIKKEQKELER